MDVAIRSSVIFNYLFIATKKNPQRKVVTHYSRRHPRSIHYLVNCGSKLKRFTSDRRSTSYL